MISFDKTVVGKGNDISQYPKKGISADSCCEAELKIKSKILSDLVK